MRLSKPTPGIRRPTSQITPRKKVVEKVHISSSSKCSTEEIDEDDLEAAQAVDMPSSAKRPPRTIESPRSPFPEESPAMPPPKKKAKVQLSYEDYTVIEP